jgi:hypothetical protein
MADTSKSRYVTESTNAPAKYLDNGDGTYLDAVGVLGAGGIRTLYDANGRTPVVASGLISTDGVSASTAGLAVEGATTARGLAVVNYRFNGTTWDRERGNQDLSVLVSAARTTTQTGSDLVNYNGRGTLVVVLDMTVVGTGSVTLSIEGKDVVSGKYYTILTGAAVITDSTNVYRVGVGLTPVANATVSDFIPRTFRVNVTANNANAATYSVGASLIQ